MQCTELKYVYVDILTIYIILWWSNQMLVIHNIASRRQIRQKVSLKCATFTVEQLAGAESSAVNHKLQRAPSLNRTIQSTVEGKLHCCTAILLA